MFIKGSIAAGVMAAVLAFAPEAAMAKTKIHIGIGAGSDYCFHRPYWPACRFGYGYGYRFGYYRPPMGAYYSPRLYPRYAYPRYAYRISCGEAREIVRDQGFRKVRTRNCGGTTGSFYGVKRGYVWLVRVNKLNGRIASARPL